MKTVLDTNILVSACWKPDGLEARTVGLACEGAFELCVSGAIIAEYREVLARPKLAALWHKAGELLAGLERVWRVYEALDAIALCRDDDDNRFLECACAASAEFLVTGNLRHYPDTCGSTRIVNARQFLTERFQLQAFEPGERGSSL